MDCENTVTLCGMVHLPQGDMEDGNQLGRYLRFSVKLTVKGYDGIDRTNFLPVRVFDPALQSWLRTKKEGDGIRLKGSVRSSLGSGEMYVHAESMEDMG